MGIFERAAAPSPSANLFDPGSLTNAWGLLQGVQPGGTGHPPIRGTQEFLKAYSEMPWLRAVSGRVATAVASAEWELFVVRATGGKARRDAKVMKFQRSTDRKERVALRKELAEAGDLEQIGEHPFLNLMSSANTYHTGYGMRKLTQLSLDLVGDAFWLKERDRIGTVVGIWPVPAHWIMSTPTPTFPFFRVQYRAWRQNIPDTEFVWFSDDDPFNPYARGSGLTRAMTDELETDEYTAKYLKSFYFNQARPDLIVWPKNGQTMRDAEVSRLQDQWMSQNQGFFRAFRTYFMNREVEVKDLGSSSNFRSQQMTQIREYERNTILQCYGLPPEILGVIEHSNRSTIDAASYLMGRYVVEPRLEFQRSVLQERLLPEFDERLVLEYVSPTDEDHVEQLQAATAAPWSLSIDEWRQRAGAPPLEDDAGKRFVLPLNVEVQDLVASAGEPITPPAPAAPPGQPAMVPPPEEVPPDDQVAAALDAGDKELAAALRKAVPATAELPEATVAAARQEPLLARALARAWGKHAAGLERAALASLARNSALVGEALDLSGLARAQTAVLGPQLAAGFLNGAEVGATALRRHGVPVRRAVSALTRKARVAVAVDFAAVNPEATAWAASHAADLVQADADVRAMIRALVARANADGLTPDETADLIRSVIGLTPRQVDIVLTFQSRLFADGVATADVLRRTARYAAAQLSARAMTIARTELIAALNGGQQALWRAAVSQGVIRQDQFRKVWIATDDDLTCAEECEPLSEERVAIGEPFSSGDDGPPAHPNCRCALGLVPA